VTGLSGLRGDINGPWEHELYDETWFDFDHAAIELADKLGITPSAAQAQLDKLCASGKINHECLSY
jgi:DNA-binding MarR family transcriptional regulator